MTKIAYFDCFSGCAGDMLIGSLLDAGLDIENLQNELDKLNIGGYHVTVNKVRRSAIMATKFDVVVDENAHHPHRSLSHILHLIDQSELSGRVKQRSSDIFRRLGRIEADIHGVPLEEVHFHEIGAVDSIVDIVGSIIGLETMGIEECFASPLPVGSGTVATEHGILPVPVPATVQILAEAGAPLVSGDKPGLPQGELVTPTGAVLVAGLASFGQPPMKVTGVGYGAGTKDFPGWPNVMRVLLGERTPEETGDDLRLLETNIDDMNPQIYGYIMDRLFTAGAADVWLTPIQMKKNRPATMLSVLVPAGEEPQITEIIMRETSTLGVRVRTVSRHIARREIIEVETKLGSARVKVKRYADELLGVFPEYDDCRRIAAECGLSFMEVRRIVEEAARRKLGSLPG